MAEWWMLLEISKPTQDHTGNVWKHLLTGIKTSSLQSTWYLKGKLVFSLWNRRDYHIENGWVWSPKPYITSSQSFRNPFHEVGGAIRLSQDEQFMLLEKMPFSSLKSQRRATPVCVCSSVSKQLPGSCSLLCFTLYLVIMVDKDIRKCPSEKWLCEERSRYGGTDRAKAPISPALGKWGWRQFWVAVGLSIVIVYCLF